MDAETAVRQFYVAMSTGNGELLDEILAPDWVDIPLPPGVQAGRDNFKTHGLPWMRTAFPDLVITNEDVIVSADGGKVAVRSTGRGTHRAEFLGIPATGVRIEFRAIDIHHLANGMIVKTWHLEDMLGLRDQLRR